MSSKYGKEEMERQGGGEETQGKHKLEMGAYYDEGEGIGRSIKSI